jgi:hypothetical protein
MEAVMGALFLDGGLEPVRAFARSQVMGEAAEQLAEELRSGAALGNYKSALQERCRRRAPGRRSTGQERERPRPSQALSGGGPAEGEEESRASRWPAAWEHQEARGTGCRAARAGAADGGRRKWRGHRRRKREECRRRNEHPRNGPGPAAQHPRTGHMRLHLPTVPEALASLLQTVVVALFLLTFVLQPYLIPSKAWSTRCWWAIFCW